MKVWQLTSTRNLQHVAAPDLKLDEGKVKVKITKALVSEADVAVFSGTLKVKHPFIPGKFAIGQITEVTDECYLKKGDRVYLAGTSEDETEEDGLSIAGETADGFYRDFALVNADNAYVLPASVSDEAAFLIEAVALAERVVDDLHVSVGQHLLVLGGGLYGNILCQILIYHRAVPILVDNNPERLARAKRCGIYYTFPFDETLKENVLKVTGGKKADGAVYFAFNNRIAPDAVFHYLARDTYVAFCALAGKPFPVNLQYAMKNNVAIKGVTECREYVSSAINILANKAVNYQEFPFKTYSEDSLQTQVKQLSDAFVSNGSLSEEVHLFKFVL
jgi:threonine dehydrogenase-like Zn-dependent dehydrogenase